MRKMIYLVMLGGLFGVLSGCTTPAERAARAEQDVVEMVQTYGPACEKFGYTRDSDQWRSCIFNLDNKANSNRPVTTSCSGPRHFVQCTTY